MSASPKVEADDACSNGQMIIDREKGERKTEWEWVGGPVSLCLSGSAWTEGTRGQETRGLMDTHAHRHCRYSAVSFSGIQALLCERI